LPDYRLSTFGQLSTFSTFDFGDFPDFRGGRLFDLIVRPGATSPAVLPILSARPVVL
jgi:hypothetical protein